MIYMVEIDFTNPAAEPEWDAWYRNHLHTILSVPGFRTAQRLKACGDVRPAYLAVYTADSPEVFTSDAYRAIGGGGDASARWREFIRRRRNLYAGIDRVPEITDEARMLVTEADPATFDLPDVLFATLEVAALDGAPVRRHVAVVDAARVARRGLESVAGLRVYRRHTQRHVAA